MSPASANNDLRYPSHQLTDCTLLAGIRVIDLTRFLPGAYMTALLADMGADVIKVEDPHRGDPIRYEGSRLRGHSSGHWVVGRGKRCLTLDLKTPQGYEAFLRLVDTADVIVEGFRPGVTRRLRIDFPTLVERRPALVYASLTGYGSSGPLRSTAGHDINYLSYAGVLAMTASSDGAPVIPGVQVADVGGATLLGMGLLSALHAAARTGRGNHVEVALYDAAVSWTSLHAGEAWATGMHPTPGETLLTGAFPCYNVYRCADDVYISVGAIEAKFWECFCGGIGRPDLVARQHDPEARRVVGEVIATKPRQAWLDIFEGRDACVAPVLMLPEALAHSVATDGQAVAIVPSVKDGPPDTPTLAAPVRIDGQAFVASRVPALLGEHSHELLSELGYSASDIADMRECQVTSSPV